MRSVTWIGLLVALSGFAQDENYDYFSLDLDELNEINVSSASQVDEPLREVPVPVTVVTAEMIRQSGVRNLAELLVQFVPGMTATQDHNEVNVAMRGVYGSSQQKFLILVEGHRLNNRAFSEANPGFSIGLEKIKQVEILRGPGSSLYGNVALTSVVNIILFKGEEVNGVEVVVGGGDYGQRKSSVLGGGTYAGVDYLTWGAFYASKGEKVTIPADRDYASNDPVGGSAYLDRFDEKPSYDMGLALKGQHLAFFANARYGKYSEPFTSGGPTGEIYDYETTPDFRGLKPGLSSASTHFRLKGWADFGGGSFEGNLYFDTSHVLGSLATNLSQNLVAYPGWHDRDYGFLGQYSRPLPIGKDSMLLVGVHADMMELKDSALWISEGGVLGTEPLPLMDPGKEQIYSAFVQLKHHLGERFLVNAGFRYDHKDRGVQEDVENLAPRIAFVYLPEQGLDWKLSYASSFVDAPYWYRYNRLPDYRGGAGLKPEYLDALQLTASKLWADQHNLEVNLFYNDLTDFVFRDTMVRPRDLETPIYRNAGELKSVGLELSYAWKVSRCRWDSNVTWQQALSASDYGERDGEIDNVPRLVANSSFATKLPSSLGRSTWANVNLRFKSSQRAPIRYPQFGVDLEDNRVAANLLLDVGLRAETFLVKGLSLEARVRNLLDTETFQGGSVQYPYPQVGRWYHLNLGYLF